MSREKGHLVEAWTKEVMVEDLRSGWTGDMFVECAGFADGVKYGASFIPSNLASEVPFKGAGWGGGGAAEGEAWHR